MKNDQRKKYHKEAHESDSTSAESSKAKTRGYYFVAQSMIPPDPISFPIPLFCINEVLIESINDFTKKF